MSKFLKFIVHTVVICVIIVALGLTIPPFFGVRTVVVDDPNTKTNLPMGSVTYAIPVAAPEVYQDDPILVEEDGNTYRYNIKSINLDNGSGVVVDQSVTDSKDITVAINKGYVQKVVITIGYLGYLQVATKSMEGLIILGLVLLFLIILYVIAELWKKDSSDDYEEDPTEYGGEYADDFASDETSYAEDEPKSKRQLKKEAKELKRQQKEEAREAEGRPAKKRKAEKRKVHTGGFVDDIDEDDDDDYLPEERSAVMQPAESEAHQYLKKEVAAATSIDTILPEAREEVQLNLPEEPEIEPEPEPYFSEQEEEPEIAEIRRRAIPGWNSQQLAREAEQAGQKPDVMRDDITDVTLFDYSDILDED